MGTCLCLCRQQTQWYWPRTTVPVLGASFTGTAILTQLPFKVHGDTGTPYHYRNLKENVNTTPHRDWTVCVQYLLHLEVFQSTTTWQSMPTQHHIETGLCNICFTRKFSNLPQSDIVCQHNTTQRLVRVYALTWGSVIAENLQFPITWRSSKWFWRLRVHPWRTRPRDVSNFATKRCRQYLPKKSSALEQKAAKFATDTLRREKKRHERRHGINASMYATKITAMKNNARLLRFSTHLHIRDIHCRSVCQLAVYVNTVHTGSFVHCCFAFHNHTPRTLKGTQNEPHIRLLNTHESHYILRCHTQVHHTP